MCGSKVIHMNDWNKEILILKRYAGSGIVNSLVGLVCIFSAMAIGFSPTFSNFIGYGVGFLLGFIFSKKFVFRSNGDFVGEGVRYSLFFVSCFFCNLLMLQLALYFDVNVLVSQLIAAVTYTSLMYLSSRLFIFNAKSGG
jgi:putative flippase GtrA